MTDAPRILIIDARPANLESLAAVFAEDGFATLTAGSLMEADELHGMVRPDIILTDVILPDTSEEKLLARLNELFGPRCPILVLSSKDDSRLRARCRAGRADEFLVKPTPRDALLQSARRLLEQKEDEAGASEDTNRGRGAAEQSASKLSGVLLIPRVDRSTPLGYTYPDSEFVLNDHAGAEALEELADHRVLERFLYDVVHLCPNCQHHDLNFREVCPNCASINIQWGYFLFHHICESRFWRSHSGGQPSFFCPTCNRLIPIADDGVSKGDGLFNCLDCGEFFGEPVVNCRCFNCEQVSFPRALQKRKVFSYQLRSAVPGKRGADTRLSESCEPAPNGATQTMKRAVAPATFPERSRRDKSPRASAARQFRRVLSEAGANILNKEQFRQRATVELKKSAVSDGGLALLGLWWPGLHTSCENEDRMACWRKIGAMLKTAAKCLRERDIMAVRDVEEVLILFPDTPDSMARILAERFVTYLEKHPQPHELRVHFACYPKDGHSLHDLLEGLHADTTLLYSMGPAPAVSMF